jgi:hypothetical protein
MMPWESEERNRRTFEEQRGFNESARMVWRFSERRFVPWNQLTITERNDYREQYPYNGYTYEECPSS